MLVTLVRQAAPRAPTPPACVPTPQVSDVEWLSSYPELEPVAARAAELLAAGRGEEVCCRLGVADNAPISAARFLSLYRAGGDDDMFSEGLPQQELQVRGAVSVCAGTGLRWGGEVP